MNMNFCGETLYNVIKDTIMPEQRNPLLNPEFMKVIQLKVNQTPISLPAIEEVMKALIWAQETLSRNNKTRG